MQKASLKSKSLYLWSNMAEIHQVYQLTLGLVGLLIAFTLNLAQNYTDKMLAFRCVQPHVADLFLLCFKKGVSTFSFCR